MSARAKIIKRAEIVEAIHAGTKEAYRIYERWSDGWTLKDSGVEGLLAVEIARKLYAKMAGTESLLFEVPFTKIIEWSGAPTVGRKLKTIGGGKRPDIVLFNHAGKPTCVIEVKRQIVKRDQLERDLNRLRDVISKCATQRGGSLKRAYLAIFRQGTTENLRKWIDEYFESNSGVRLRSVSVKDVRSNAAATSVHVEVVRSKVSS